MRARWMLAFGIAVLFGTDAVAIGPHSILVIASHKSPEGLAVANYYRDKRGVPPINIVRVNLPSLEAFEWPQYKKLVIDPVNAHIDKYRLRDRIAVWVETPGLPILIDVKNGSSGVVHFNKVSNPSSDPAKPGVFAENNSFFDTYRAAHPPQPGTGFLHMRLDAGTIEATKALIDRSIKADGTFPEGTIYFFDGDGPRASRKDLIPMAQRFVETAGIHAEHRPGSQLKNAPDVLGLYTGAVQIPASANTYVPGALADHLTSFGGRLVKYRGQTPARDFLIAGASATYGTVVEPYNYPAKFPAAQLYAYYALGFTAVESYWMSVLWPQQGLFLGEPLSRPFDSAPTIEVKGLEPEKIVNGTLEFDVIARAKPPGSSVTKLWVMIDGTIVFRRTISSVPEGTVVGVRWGGEEWSHTAGSDGKLSEVAAELGRVAATKGFEVTIKPGLLILFRSQSEKPGELTVQSNNPTVHAEVLGKSVPTAAPTAGSARWEVKGTASAGDKFTLTLQEAGRVVSTLKHDVPFARPAALVCTSLRLGLAEKLPKGYEIEVEANPEKRELGVIKLVVGSDRLKARPQATLHLDRAPQSKLEVSGGGTTQAFMGRGLDTHSMGIVRFAIGPSELATHPRIDTSPFPDGRHRLEILAIKGSATEASTLTSIPIQIRNGDARLTLSAISPKASATKPGKIEVAKATRPPDIKGQLIFTVNDAEVPATEVKGDVLLLEPGQWGVGRHMIGALIREGPRDRLLSDNAILFEVTP